MFNRLYDRRGKTPELMMVKLDDKKEELARDINDQN